MCLPCPSISSIIKPFNELIIMFTEKRTKRNTSKRKNMSHKGMHSEEEGMADRLPVSCKSFECL